MLACMIDSCIASAPPAVVTSATEKYLEDENVFLAWRHLEKLLPMPIACGPGVNIHESEWERSGHLLAFIAAWDE